MLWRVVLIVAALLVAFESPTLFVLFGGVLLAVFFKTSAEIVARRFHVPYKIVVALLMLLVIGGLSALVVFAGPHLVDQAWTLARAMPNALQQALQRARHAMGDGAFALPKVEELRPEMKSVVAGAQGAVAGSVEAVAALVVIGFVGLYGALDPDAYTNVALVLVSKERKARAREVLHEAGRRLGRWLIGRVVAMVFVGVVTGIGLHLLHVPLAVSLGVLAGLLAFVEYVGAVASAVPPVLLALGQGWGHVAGVCVLFLGVHLVEGYILTPFLARRAVHFPPAYTLAAQTLFGALFGPIGLTFATPTCIVGATLVEMLYVEDVLGKKR
jgi:predicted PurR-regulated permease PerM